jgi:diguanylate cyclase (GGDEF)-like protein
LQNIFNISLPFGYLVAMNYSLNKRSADCQILIVDDEKITCEMLREALEPQYKVWTCNSGSEAFALIDGYDFDLIVTDLKLPDVSGIDVLGYAKGKDEYTEVIVITGFASVDTATLAINLGVYSYLVKPLSITDFLIQVQKAIASRLFHLKSIHIMHQFDTLAPEVKVHLSDITSLYHFTRKLMLSLEISEIMRITLEEAINRIGASLAIINANILGFNEIYSMPCCGTITHEMLGQVYSINDTVLHYTPDTFKKVLKSAVIYKGKPGDLPVLNRKHCQGIPLVVTDHIIGSITLYFDDTTLFDSDNNQYLYVFTSIVASIIEHGYSALQARQQAKTDSLTGIANHRLFHESLEREISRANRKKSVFGLILIDIDNFKKINDTYGHLVGDAVIVDLTKRVNGIIRVQDILARYGGEEFGIILPETDIHGAEILASRVLHEVALKPLIVSQQELFYTVSIGLAIYNSDSPVKKDQLISTADDALYASKRNGRNRVSIGVVPL